MDAQRTRTWLRRAAAAALLAVLLLAAGCTTTPETNTPAAPAPEVIAAPEAVVAAAPAPEVAPLPALVADAPLAPAQQTLRELALDPVANLIYVTDTANQLHVLDAATYAPVKTLNGLGDRLLADPANRRLYVYTRFPPADEPGVIHVIDTTTLEEVGTIAGRALAVDSARHRLFVGEPYSSFLPGNGASVRVVDGATLDVLREIPQPGAPVYNPVRDELLIVAYTLYTADPETGAVTGDLFPELTSGELSDFLWCNGCEWVDGAFYDAGSGLIAVDLDRHCTGAGCGYDQPATFLDAATLTPQPEALAPLLQAACGATPHVVGEVAGRRYRNDLYARYVVYTNFRVADSAGAPLTWREGFRTSFINPNTNQGYLEDGTVVDLATLAPIGAWPPSCLLAYDPDAGLLYGKRGQNLVVVAEQGGVAPAPLPPSPAALDDALTIQEIRVSPDYPADSTLLIELAGGGLLRSTDGGATFMRLHGGLPEPTDIYPYVFYAFFSPNYAADRTIYVTGHQAETLGAGVWRSQDGGDTFVAQWQDLIYRRGQEIVFAPDFAVSQTLAVRAPFYAIAHEPKRRCTAALGRRRPILDGGGNDRRPRLAHNRRTAGRSRVALAERHDTGHPHPRLRAGGRVRHRWRRVADGDAADGRGFAPRRAACTRRRDHLRLRRERHLAHDRRRRDVARLGRPAAGRHDLRERHRRGCCFARFPRRHAPALCRHGRCAVVVLDPAQMNWANVATTAPATPTQPAPPPAATPCGAVGAAPAHANASCDDASCDNASCDNANCDDASCDDANCADANCDGGSAGIRHACRHCANRTPSRRAVGRTLPPRRFAGCGLGGQRGDAAGAGLGDAGAAGQLASLQINPSSRGRMIWVEQQDSIYVIYNDGSWRTLSRRLRGGYGVSATQPSARRAASCSRSAALAKSGASRRRCANGSAGALAPEVARGCTGASLRQKGAES
jgi:hypothetical protein